jgi:aconitate hydratase
MGILPLQFEAGDSAAKLGLTGEERFDVLGLRERVASAFQDGRGVRVKATRDDGSAIEFPALVRIDTPQELLYYRHGGILQYVLRQLLGGRDRAVAVAPAGASSAQATPGHEPTEGHVDKGSENSFPASDPPAY